MVSVSQRASPCSMVLQRQKAAISFTGHLRMHRKASDGCHLNGWTAKLPWS